jgi:hypothetical protein
MRTKTVLALGLLLTLASAGCARGSGNDPGVATANGANPTASASASAAAGDNTDIALKFAQCMRAQGMTWFPDPQAGGKMSVRIPSSVTKEKMDAATEACKKYAPNGGAAPKMDAAALEKMRQYAECMRENGVANFPDPSAGGGLSIDLGKLGMSPDDPKFVAADKACSKYTPAGGSTGTANGSGSGQSLSGASS